MKTNQQNSAAQAMTTAWVRDYTYADYLMHAQQVGAAVVSQSQYGAVQQAFNASLVGTVAAINTITTDVHNPVVPAKKPVITRCVCTDHMNEIQFMGEAWANNCTYAQYKESAEHCDKAVMSLAEYIRYCESCEQQAKEL